MSRSESKTITGGLVEAHGPVQRELAARLVWSACIAALVLGIAVRIWFVVAAPPHDLTFHSGGSDAPAYNLLAKNILAHRGLSYAGEPSAFRPPGYPLLVAAMMSESPTHYIAYVRWLQFLLGLATIAVCSAAARRLFDSQAAMAVWVVGLFMPTLVFATAQVLTECLAAFLTALFLFFLVRHLQQADLLSASGMGMTAGVGALIRFNAAALPFFAGCAVLQTRRKRYRPSCEDGNADASPVLRASIVLLVPLLIVLPWLVRNELAFHGRVLFSTQTGPNAVQGVVSPEGRTQPGDSDRLHAAMGWVLSELETNAPSRRSLPSEADLNVNALRIVPGLWSRLGWGAVPQLGKKLAVFWLSTDQIEDTSGFRFSDRILRAGGVFYYWIVLALAIAGWFGMRRSHPAVAVAFAAYAGGLTLLHLPLVMSTRIRIPLIEPLLLILMAGPFKKRWRGEETREHSTAVVGS